MCVYASCTRANFTRKCTSYTHIAESEPSLANRRRFRLLGRPGRAAETIEAQPNQANRKLIGCVGGWVIVHMPTASHTLCYLAIGPRSTVCRRRQGRAPHFDQDRLVVLVDSELDPAIGRPRQLDKMFPQTRRVRATVPIDHEGLGVRPLPFATGSTSVDYDQSVAAENHRLGRP